MKAAQKGTKEASWVASLLTITRYELLSSFRRKKLSGVLLLGVVVSAFTWNLPLIGVTNNQLPTRPYADAVTGLHYDFFFGGALGAILLTLVITMDSISGEFERGTLATLLTKPVSRGIVYFGKVLASVLTLLVAITVILVSGAFFGTVTYGPQNNLPLLFFYLIGYLIDAIIFVAVFYALASLTKSTMLTVLTAVGYITVEQVLEATGSWVKDYIPGYGVGLHQPSVASGSSGIGPNLAYYLLHPDAQMIYGTFGTEALSLIIIRAVAVSIFYIVVFLSIGYYWFKRAEIK